MPEIELQYDFRKKVNRTNEPGTCLYCGNKLRKPAVEYLAAEGNRGDYADNAFCGLRCGYMFGVLMASFGKRLIQRKDD